MRLCCTDTIASEAQSMSHAKWDPFAKYETSKRAPSIPTIGD